jgi:hypothetical protein
MLLPELEPPEHLRRALAVRAELAFDPEHYCHPCPLNTTGSKTRPLIPLSTKLVVVTDIPGPSRMLLDALGAAGIDRSKVAWTSLARCHPPGDDLLAPSWVEATHHCRNYLDADIAGTAPLLLVGAGPAQAFLGGRTRVGASRGLWAQVGDRDAFVIRNPSHLSAVKDVSTRSALLNELRSDVANMADHVLDREVTLPFSTQVFETPAAAEGYLRRLGKHPGPWAFDIESYDAKEFPSRKSVSTDPCHPDFRVRGVAFATAADVGGYVDLAGMAPELVHPYFDMAFCSAAEKWAFNGHFDEEGLTYPGYVTAVRNRGGDGMLAMLSLSDGRHESLRLEWAVVNILGERQYWGGLDKSKMRDIATQVVARNAVGDACHTFRLCDVLHGRLERGEYF